MFIRFKDIADSIVISNPKNLGETPNYAFSVNFFIRSVFRVKGNVGGLEDREFHSESIAAIFDASCPLVWEIPAFECFDRIHS